MLDVSKAYVVQMNDWIRVLSHRLIDYHADCVVHLAHETGVFVDAVGSANALDRMDSSDRDIRDKEAELEAQHQRIQQAERWDRDGLEFADVERKSGLLPAYGRPTLVSGQAPQLTQEGPDVQPAVPGSLSDDMEPPPKRRRTDSEFEVQESATTAVETLVIAEEEDAAQAQPHESDASQDHSTPVDTPNDQAPLHNLAGLTAHHIALLNGDASRDEDTGYDLDEDRDLDFSHSPAGAELAQETGSEANGTVNVAQPSAAIEHAPEALRGFTTFAARFSKNKIA